MTSAQSFISCGDGAAALDTLVLLHGWGSDSSVWEPVLQELGASVRVITIDLPGFGGRQPALSVDGFLESVLSELPEQFYVLGWSLGGMLAMRLAGRFPSRVKGIVTLAANLRFVADCDWPEAMNAEVFEQFTHGFVQSPEATLSRFAGLNLQGDGQHRQCLSGFKRLSRESYQQRSGDWRETLGWLRGFNVQEDFARIGCDGVHLFGREDRLVPVTATPAIQALNPSQQVRTLVGVGHLLPWTAAQDVCKAVREMLLQRYRVDKRSVAKSFGRAASTYDSVAQLQRQVADKLCQQLPAFGEGPWLDLGVGTGYCLPMLQARTDDVLGMDLAYGMLDFARSKMPEHSHWICADAEQLPLASESMDLIFSSLAIQWCSDLHKLFREVARVLRPGGRALFATLGPETLSELRHAWSTVDDYRHVNHFVPGEHLRMAAQASDLAVTRWEEETIELHYEKVQQLTHELKALGAHNMNADQNPGLGGRERLRKFIHAYEGFRNDEGWLPATYRVYYLSVTRPLV